MKSLLITVLTLISAMFSLSVNGDTPYSNPRWYSPEQSKLGATLYQKHCQLCHGEGAASVKRWDKMDKSGQFPPPPLNGTGHTWHHPMPLLRRTIREGGVMLGGRMPAFKDTLSAQEIDSVIAWIQSLWPDEIYARWSGQWPGTGQAQKTPWSLEYLLKP